VDTASCACGGTHLTAREIDVLLRAAAGMSASQIAASLHISHRTVEYHVASVLRRTGAQNAVEAVARCYSAGILIPAQWPPRWSGQFCLSPAGP
jgi:DNA-binding CsgD family transcriptional regulator